MEIRFGSVWLTHEHTIAKLIDPARDRKRVELKSVYHNNGCVQQKDQRKRKKFKGCHLIINTIPVIYFRARVGSFGHCH